ncbi:MAG: hypothetical protein A2017_13835 [Lentisphaerae bacterium GWF2_44_16]|nr:MAG: hypothetical protein A2017_13835 [Lentisphaerae bacterium GWF2_44_16]
MKKYIMFTLIELLIVISIIAILAALLLPALSKARDKVIELECGGKVKQITTATLMYASDFNGCGPVGDMIGNALFMNDIRGGIAGYLGINKDYYIGGSKYGIMPPISMCSKGARYGDTNPYFSTLYTEGTRNMNNSYAINYFLCCPNASIPLNVAYAASLKRVVNPSGRMLVCTVGIDHWNSDTARGGYCENRDVMAFRHNKSANIGFVDGHIRCMKRGDVPIYGSSYDTGFFWKEY